jgi:N-acetylmuramoyl-L-alanine amidase
MLDPGHGGIDTGAIGKNGSKEKHVVLAIAKNVRDFTQQRH